MRTGSVAPDPRPTYARARMTDPTRAPEPAAALTRNALIPLSIATCFVLVYVVEAPPWTVLPIGLVVMALYLAAPRLGRRSLARFDRDLVQLLARGSRAELWARYHRAVGMRLFEAPARVAERRGIVAAETGDPEGARDAYQEALEGYADGAAPRSVQLGLAHASYAIGDDEAAIRAYRAVLSGGASLPRVARNLAHALARRGQDLGQAERLAEQLLREAPEPEGELLLLRALVHARKGQRGPARKLLAKARAEGEAAEELREEVRRALEEEPEE